MQKRGLQRYVLFGGRRKPCVQSSDSSPRRMRAYSSYISDMGLLNPSTKLLILYDNPL